MKPLNQKTKYLKLFFFFLPLFLLSGCGTDGSVPPVAPFCDAVWEDTLQDILSYEGNDYETYASVYGGTCYTYPKTYQDRQGTIKYMFDGEERLMCIAWTCSADEEQELYNLYGLIEESVDASLNEENPETDSSSNAGRVWYREDGNIVLSLMITSDLKALQYAYLHPDVSSQPKD